jgi:DNA-binding NarL/FixJ family response regulator
MLRVGIIDDRALSRAGLRQVLHGLDSEGGPNPRTSIVAEGKRAQAAALVNRTRPDLLISGDAHGKDSLPLVEIIARLPAAPAVLVITEHITEADARILLARGAAGILLQRSALQHLAWALTAVTEGSRALSPEIADAFIQRFSAPPPAAAAFASASPVSAHANVRCWCCSVTACPTAPLPRRCI